MSTGVGTEVEGFVRVESAASVDETLGKIEAMLAAKSVKVFAVIDHSGEAAKAGLSMRPTKVVIFGSPKAGTPVMVGAPTAAIDLPLKLLVWQDAEDKVWVGYNSVAYLARRHGIAAELAGNLAAVESLARAVGKEV